MPTDAPCDDHLDGPKCCQFHTNTNAVGDGAHSNLYQASLASFGSFSGSLGLGNTLPCESGVSTTILVRWVAVISLGYKGASTNSYSSSSFLPDPCQTSCPDRLAAADVCDFRRSSVKISSALASSFLACACVERGEGEGSGGRDKWAGRVTLRCVHVSGETESLTYCQTLFSLLSTQHLRVS
jgi:hypothetical protein